MPTNSSPVNQGFSEVTADSENYGCEGRTVAPQSGQQVLSILLQMPTPTRVMVTVQSGSSIGDRIIQKPILSER